MLSCHTVSIRCRFVQLLEKIDRRTEKTLEAYPQSLRTGDTALVKIIPLESVCVETYDKYPSLGRFAIRDMKRTVAVGTIKQLTHATVVQD